MSELFAIVDRNLAFASTRGAQFEVLRQYCRKSFASKPPMKGGSCQRRRGYEDRPSGRFRRTGSMQLEAYPNNQPLELVQRRFQILEADLDPIRYVLKRSCHLRL